MDEKRKCSHGIWNTYCYLYHILWGYSKKIVAYQAAQVLFSGVLPLVWVLVPAYIVRQLERHVPIQTAVVRILVVFAVAGVLSAIQVYLENRNRMQYIEFRINHVWPQLLSRYVDLDYEVSERQKTGELTEKAMLAISMNEAGLEGLFHLLTSFLKNCIGLVLYLTVISMAEPWLLVLLTAASVLQLWINQKIQHAALKYRHEEAKCAVTRRYLNQVLDDVSNGKDIRIFQLGEWMDRKFQRVNCRLKQLVGKRRTGFFMSDLLGLLFQTGRDVVCYGYLFYLLGQGMPASKFVLYLGVVTGCAGWFEKIFDNITMMKQSVEHMNDYREFYELPYYEQPEEKAKKLPEQPMEIEFRNVSFQYPGAEQPVLQQISFHMKPGERYALVGVNGAGKSTLVKLMAGLYQPTTGQIYINGKNLADLNVAEYWDMISVVFQESFCISTSIAENVAPVLEKYRNTKKIRLAIEKAGLLEKVESLKDGLDTYLNKDISESGIRLSGGEEQKLMLARAVYKPSSLLMLDEPTAALDAIAESQMYEQYDALRDGKTSFFISHRLASTRFCDQILFLENGRIQEQGTHAELMERHGAYCRMFEVQSQYYKEDGNREDQAEPEGCW